MNQIQGFLIGCLFSVPEAGTPRRAEKKPFVSAVAARCLGFCRPLPLLALLVSAAAARCLPLPFLAALPGYSLSLDGSHRRVIAGTPVHLLLPLEHLPGKISKSVAIGEAPNREGSLQ